MLLILHEYLILRFNALNQIARMQNRESQIYTIVSFNFHLSEKNKSDILTRVGCVYCNCTLTGIPFFMTIHYVYQRKSFHIFTCTRV